MRVKMLLCFCLGLFVSSSLFGASEIIVFGLKHTVISNADLSIGDPAGPLYVYNTLLAENGVCDETNCLGDDAFGVSVQLGAADAGLLIAPDAERIDGASLEGTSYGIVSGVPDSLIGAVTGTRLQWADYAVHVDFSPVGATSYTYLVYFHDLKTLEVTNLGPDLRIYTGNTDPGPPRVNPLWLKDGRAAAVIDFGNNIADIHVPQYHVYASRIVVIAEGGSDVEQVSRLDVIGRHGLPSFKFYSERVGKFRLHHQSLGNVNLGLTPTQLVLSNVLSSPGVNYDGLFTELPRVQGYEATLLPLSLTNDTFALSFSMTPVTAISPDPASLEEIRFSRTNGIATLTPNFDSLSANVRVYHQGAFVGSLPASNTVPGRIIGSNFVILSYRAAATQANEPAHIGFRLASDVTFSNANGTLVGDEFHVSSQDIDNTVGVLTSFTLLGENLGDVTLTGMQTFTAPPEPLRLRVARSGSSVRVSWPYAPDYYLFGKADLNDTSWDFVGGGSYSNFQSSIDDLNDGYSRFMRLQHGYADVLVMPEP